MKKNWDKLWKVIFKYESHIYLCSGMMILFFLVALWKHHDWRDSLLKLEKENASLVMVLDQTNRALGKSLQVSKDQSDFIDFRSEMIQNQREVLEKQDLAIERQNDILNHLVNYLKRIGHWPLKPLPPEKPISPGSWAESKTIILDEEKISHIR